MKPITHPVFGDRRASKYRVDNAHGKPKIDLNGKEVLDETPVPPPVGHLHTDPVRDRIRDFLRQEQARLAEEAAGGETFEDLNDFGVDDDDTYDPDVPWENGINPDELHREVLNELHSPSSRQGRPEGGEASLDAPPAPQPSTAGDQETS